MRIVPFLVSAVATAGLVYALNRPLGSLPMAAGKFLSPQYGFWQNAEPASKSFDEELSFSGLKGKAEVYFDDRLVPHVFAENDEDLYFIQGYLHAKFRLFQMDLQTRAAAGRASEFAGAKAINFDKEQRRLGMVFAAENALKEIEKDPVSKAAFDAYTSGINAYIGSLREADIPIEYKLMNVKPEKWSNLRSALLLKMMAKMLSSGTEHDLAYTNAKAVFMPEELNKLYPQVPDSLLPIVPKGTVFEKPAIIPVQPASADSLYFGKKDTVSVKEISRPNENNGSNNWVVSGSKTQSGAPILCNDPHLEMSLPSIWYEIQLQTPVSNAYGVSIPGAPFIIIGFNDSIAWGVTNSQRDVKDYYEIRFKDKTRKEYWFNNQWTAARLQVEEIKVKGGAVVFDTVAYTVYGPVMYDESFQGTDSSGRGRNLALRWTAHDPSNEGFTFYKLNRAKNYDDYVNAIATFQCPGQNFVFASKNGDIALWQQGKFPARWKGQGLYVMPGEDSSYMWQGFIPQPENPHAKNPERGYLQSGNQRPADSAYPYFIPGTYLTARAITIDNKLAAMTSITPADMMKLQNDYFNTTAEDVRPLLMRYVQMDELNATDKKYLDLIKKWDLNASADSKEQTIYNHWWGMVTYGIWYYYANGLDSLTRAKMVKPTDQTILEMIIKDSSCLNVKLKGKTVKWNIVTSSLKVTSGFFELRLKKGNGLEWYKTNHPAIYHIADASRNSLLPFARTKLHIGGNNDIINAVKGSHGPSWRMIVHMTTPTEAYAVYPGGQSGNPGSKFYDSFVDKWVEGQYNKLWFMREGDKTDKNVKWVMKFKKG
ncbi:MAG TPA: penicillin acylase family protein [Chitinophagaceae bacterium]|nr:penicillin acylase family protein [Chitinophagaceae bacterium]HMU58299.1 penicillin acylase family protein [Chitinophagaceae bacterium]